MPKARAKIKAINQNSGIAAIKIESNNAVPAARRTDAVLVANRTQDRTANGNAIAAMTVPKRPAVIAPVTDGSTAYMTAAHTRTGLLTITPRKVKYAAHPANASPSNITICTTSALLPRKAAEAANSVNKYGGAGVLDPGPTSCQPWVYISQRSVAPSGVGNSTPPCNTPSPHQRACVAMMANTMSDNTMITLGRHRIRLSKPELETSR
ncbi:unannotated protein [freshwater metagenome]|uniref:Unannotated protein n=1 Tax=freshwater metagenome TaxID=449393 RepID=A0A6J7SQL8_9ZZZZ